MMVVIGLIAIITAYAVPGLKKAYEDFKVNETLDHLSTFMSSFRSYYLVMNEFPPDGDCNYVKGNCVWSLPNNYYTRIWSDTNASYRLNIMPYQATGYDIENWTEYDRLAVSRHQFSISLPCEDRPQNVNIWAARLAKKYPAHMIYVKEKKAHLCLPEIPPNYVTDGAGLRNRFY